jgi:hypothetical protein
MKIKNPQANFVQCACQTLDNMVCSYELENFKFDYSEPWSKILGNQKQTICLTPHSMLDSNLAQIMFGKDMLFDLSFTTNHNELKNRKI